MKCRIQWIDEQGKTTPDQNEAVAMANYHVPIWSHPGGHIDNRIVGYQQEVEQSIPICADHLAQMKPSWKGWSVSPLPQEKAQ